MRYWLYNYFYKKYLYWDGRRWSSEVLEYKYWYRYDYCFSFIYQKICNILLSSIEKKLDTKQYNYWKNIR
jgi:hypothetical protein